MEDAARTSEQNLAKLVEIARTLDGRDALAQAICAHVVEALGLSGASISIVVHDTGEARLDSIAAVGQLSSFMLDLSTPLQELTDAARAALGGEPLFVGNPHGVQADAGEAEGVSRWRKGFGAHAYAVLGLTVADGTLGVLTLEWPEPHPFDDADRESLQLFADVAALALRGALSPGVASPPTVVAPTVRPSCDEAEIAAYQMSSRGLVVPEAATRSWSEPPVLRIWTATTPADVECESVGFTEVTGVPAGIAVVVGAATSGTARDSAHAVTAGLGVVHAAATHGSGPGEIMGMLGSSMRSHGAPAWASAVVAVLSPTNGAMEIAEAGSAGMLCLGRGGRLDFFVSQAQPAGTGHAAELPRIELALPGDRIALLSGGVASSIADDARAAAAQRILASLPEHGGAETARALLSLVCQEGTAAAVSVIEIALRSPAGAR